MAASSVFLIFGRFQPPTIGHERLFKTALAQGRQRRADVAVFLSQTEDRKNPLPYRDKVAVIKRSVPGLIMGPPSARTPAEALTWARDAGYRDITLMVGDDRLDGFKKMAASWQNAEDPERNAHVQVTALPRTGAMDASKVSGTVARQYAQRGDLKNFKKILISGAQDDRIARQFMRQIQDALGTIKEMTMPSPEFAQTSADPVTRIVSELLNDIDTARVEPVRSVISSKSPDNHGVIKPGERVPDDSPENNSVVVLYPDRKLKYNMKMKAQSKQSEQNSPEMSK